MNSHPALETAIFASSFSSQKQNSQRPSVNTFQNSGVVTTGGHIGNITATPSSISHVLSSPTKDSSANLIDRFTSKIQQPPSVKMQQPQSSRNQNLLDIVYANQEKLQPT